MGRIRRMVVLLHATLAGGMAVAASDFQVVTPLPYAGGAAALDGLARVAVAAEARSLAAGRSRLLPDGLDRDRTALWAVSAFPGDIAPILAHGSDAEISGVALVLPPASGDPLSPADLSGLLARRRSGLNLAERIREVHRALPDEKALGLCVPFENIRAETSRAWYVDVHSLVSDGTLDAVWLSDNPSWNGHRLRLLRMRPLQVGVFVRAKTTGELLSDVRIALANPTMDGLWLWDLQMQEPLRLVAAAIHDWNENRRLAEALQQDVRTKKLVPALSVAAARGDNQATVHGAGQSFTPARSGYCRAVRIYATLRRCRDALPQPLEVELRPDDDGKPGEQVLANGRIPASAFGHEPSYRWGIAAMTPTPLIVAGRRYWITLPSATSYVWRLVSKGADEQSHAWSSSYDYRAHSWVLEVFVEPRQE